MESLRQELEADKQTLAERLEDIESERLSVLEEAHLQALRELEELRAEMQAIKRQSSVNTDSPAKTKKALEQQIRALEEKASEPLEKTDFSSQPSRPLRAGDRVYIRNLKTEGSVLEIGEEIVEVQVGKMRVKVDLRNIERSKKGTQKTKRPVPEIAPSETPRTSVFHPSPGVELHLRGMRADEALDELEHYLDNAYAAGLPYARIVHGKGTGILRQIVRQALGSSALVANWENAMDNEGGEGVTVVHFKES